MSEHDVDSAVRQYRERRPFYESFTLKLRELMEELLEANQLEVANIEFRTKPVASFSEKIRRDTKSYDDPLSEVTDLCGLRVVTYYIEDVDAVGEILRREFVIDEENSLDKSEIMDPDRFGYLSVHYVLSLNPRRSRLTEWKAYSGTRAEIQVRTVLQHAWGAIDHKLRYKAAREVPTSLKRQLFRLSALLELADEEFSQLRERGEETTEEYVSDVERGEYDIEVNLDSLDSYLRSSDVLDKWKKQALEGKFRDPLREQDVDDLRRLVRVVQDAGITHIREFDDLLREADAWGLEVLERIGEISTRGEFVPYAVPYDVLTILVMKARSEEIGEDRLREINFRSPLRDAILEVVGYAR